MRLFFLALQQLNNSLSNAHQAGVAWNKNRDGARPECNREPGERGQAGEPGGRGKVAYKDGH